MWPQFSCQRASPATGALHQESLLAPGVNWATYFLPPESRAMESMVFQITSMKYSDRLNECWLHQTHLSFLELAPIHPFCKAGWRQVAFTTPAILLVLASPMHNPAVPPWNSLDLVSFSGWTWKQGLANCSLLVKCSPLPGFLQMNIFDVWW